MLSRRQSYACELYLVRQYRRGPGRPRKAHGQSATARRCRQLHKDPWLLATSLPHTGGAARLVVKLYALRMRIEQGIRDTKDPRWGFAPLHAAAWFDRRGTTEALLERGADATVLDAEGRSALEIARERGARTAEEVLLAWFDDQTGGLHVAAEDPTSDEAAG